MGDTTSEIPPFLWFSSKNSKFASKKVQVSQSIGPNKDSADCCVLYLTIGRLVRSFLEANFEYSNMCGTALRQYIMSIPSIIHIPKGLKGVFVLSLRALMTNYRYESMKMPLRFAGVERKLLNHTLWILTF